MLTIIAAVSIMSIGHGDPNALYISVSATNQGGTFRSVLHLPARIPKADDAVTTNRLNHAYITIENVSDKPRPIWDALWPGSTLFYIKGDYAVLPPACVPRVSPPLLASDKKMLNPGQMILQDIRLSHFWDIDKMGNGSSKATIVYDDEDYWPDSEKASTVGPFFYSFKVAVKEDVIYFERVSESSKSEQSKASSTITVSR